MTDKNDLTILPIVPLKDNEILKYHPNLPSISKNRGFILNIIGSTCCGKTVIINNLILGKNFWGGKKMLLIVYISLARQCLWTIPVDLLKNILIAIPNIRMMLYKRY